MERKTLNFYRELSWQELQKGNRAIVMPFQLNLADSNEPLIVTQMVRIIPGKRIVAFGTWGGKEVVAKLFYESGKATQHAVRDRKGINALIQSGITTPTLFYQGASIDKKIQVLLFEKIQNSLNFYQLWQRKTNAEQIENLLHALTLELATQHVLGLLQKDMHFKNFLITAKQIYILDGSDIEKFDLPLSRETSFENLALFIAQLGVNARQYQSELLHTYAESRGWKLMSSDYKFLDKKITKWQKYRWNKFQKKIFRHCSAFAKIKSTSESGMYDREEDATELQNFLTNCDEVFTQFVMHTLKNGRTSTVVKATMDGHQYVIKRYNVKNVSHYLRRCLRPTRAAKSWKLSQYLTLMGIQTARPIAFIEKRFLGLRGKSYFVMEQVAGMHIGEYFAQTSLSDENKKRMVDKVTTLFKDLAQLRLTHGDLKMTNILIRDDEPVLIDLDGMQEHNCPFGFKRAFQRELMRFLHNWLNQPSLYKLFEEKFTTII